MNLKELFQKIGKKKIIIAIVVIVFVGGMIGIWALISTGNDYNYGEIVIAKDKDFEKRYDFPGAGTLSDPYRIENRIINTDLDFGILITSTTKYFIIQNCTITGSAGGIYIHSIARDTCLIRNNTINVLPEGIGIQVELGPHSIVENNIITAENTSSLIGIYVFSSEDSYIAENSIANIEHGIEVFGYSDDTNVVANNCSNCDYGIFIDSRNWFDSEGAHTVELSQIEVKNNNCYNNSKGIYFLSDVSDSDIIGNNCSFNTITGIEVFGSNTLDIQNNHLLNNTQGIALVEVESILISSNLLEYNTFYAVNLTDSSSVSIYRNNFIGNNNADVISGAAQAFDNNPTSDPSNQNYWYVVSESEGNYWSDLSWVPAIEYEIDGGDNTDLYPLELPI